MHQSHWIGNIPRWWSTGFQVHKVHACPLPNQTRYHRGRIQCSLRFDLSQSGRYRANNGTPTWFRRSGTRCRQFAHRAYAPNEHVAEIGPCHELNALVQPLALRDGSISTAERSQYRQRIEIVVEIRQFGFDTACRSCPDIKFSISANLGSDFHRTASGIVHTVFDSRWCESTVDAEKQGGLINRAIGHRSQELYLPDRNGRRPGNEESVSFKLKVFGRSKRRHSGMPPELLLSPI